MSRLLFIVTPELEFASTQHVTPLHLRRQSQRVCYRHQRHAMLAIEIGKHVAELFRGFFVERSGRLIRENDLRLVDQCPDHGDPLAFTTRHLARTMRKVISQTHTVKEFPGPLRGGFLQGGVGVYQGRYQNIIEGGALGQ